MPPFINASKIIMSKSTTIIVSLFLYLFFESPHKVPQALHRCPPSARMGYRSHSIRINKSYGIIKCIIIR